MPSWGGDSLNPSVGELSHNAPIPTKLPTCILKIVQEVEGHDKTALEQGVGGRPCLQRAYSGRNKNKMDDIGQAIVAERVGFEPTRGLLPYAISSRACSATPAPLREAGVHRHMAAPWRRGWDLNPRPDAIGNRFSRAAP